jgi:putative ABC transport system permease protein
VQISSGQTLRVALDAVWAHRFRSLLTILGIVIGITTVVTVSSLLSGVRKNIVVFFQEFGPDNIFVMKSGGGPGQGNSPKERRRKPIRPEYAQVIREFSPSLKDTSINVFIPPFSNGTLLAARVPGAESDNINIVGSTANASTTQPRELRVGRYFTPEEDSRRARVAVIGNNVATALFPDGKEIGRTFNLGGAEYTVVGVFAPAKGGFFGENGMDRQVVLPLETAHSRYPQSDRFMIVAQAKPGLRKQAQEEVEAALRRIRHIPRNQENDFALTTADQIIENFDKITGMIVVVSTAISCLGLLVGGIGVMNIMLVSVTERTREIGVRKALGARRFDIVFQFLLEAMALTGIGGVLGIILSVLVTFLVGVLVPSLPSEVSAWAVIAGFTVSVMVGLFFGVWPAFTAARLDPVEALRYE